MDAAQASVGAGQSVTDAAIGAAGRASQYLGAITRQCCCRVVNFLITTTMNLLEFLVAQDGNALESKVLHSSGFPLLDNAALESLAKYRFTPPASVGRTAPVRAQVQYAWKLDDAKSPAEQLAGWQRKLAAAEQGNAAAQHAAGMGYLFGAPGVEKNAAEGIRWLRASAAQEYGPGMESLSLQLQNGLHIARDPAQAAVLLEKSAGQGLVSAQIGLAMLLIRGEGLPRDEVRAKALLEGAVARGSTRAKAPLAMLLFKQGDGGKAETMRLLHEAVAQDKAKAVALYERVAATGFPLARDALKRLKPQGN